MRKIFVCFAFAIALPAAAMAGPRNQGYTQLSGDEIRTAFADRVFTEHGHAALRFSGDGKITGSKDRRAWSVANNTLCLEGAEQTCFDVWRKGREIQMFAGEDEGEGSLSGVLQ
ncbi:MAG: hypothetical protein JWN07_888 [Hyphomicrobiales bacterium]|nr:hypothetical protein [Hyphomicrobiales bacterium]